MQNNQFDYDGQKIDIDITYLAARQEFRKLGLDLFSIFADESVITTIMLNDSVMMEIWYYYVKSASNHSMEEALQRLDTHKMQTFKEAFWNEVVNFSPPPARETLYLMWKEIKKSLKSPEKKLLSSSSDSSEEQE